ncbi:hypothetical protein [Verminephrobacter aporrectodeae]|nr:hypothetical protein [Verminephrobacter aporrectodeae]
MTQAAKPVVALSLGDPAGIGPERMSVWRDRVDFTNGHALDRYQGKP